MTITTILVHNLEKKVGAYLTSVLVESIEAGIRLFDWIILLPRMNLILAILLSFVINIKPLL